MNTQSLPTCPLCAADGGVLIWRGAQLRVVRVVDQADFPAFYRVIWSAHRAEFTDLDPGERVHCMQTVAIVEQTLRTHLQPAKINLASLGNVVPHLHWHVVARFVDDSHFPDAIWAAPRRAAVPARVQQVQAVLPAVDAALRARLHAPTKPLG